MNDEFEGTFVPVGYGETIKVSQAALDEDRKFWARKPTRRARFIAWVSHWPLVIVFVLGVVCGAAVYEIFQLI